MEQQKLDFHSTFRTLCYFKPSLLDESKSTSGDALQTFISKLLSRSSDADTLDHAKATGEWLEWLERYAKRIQEEKEEWAGVVDVDAEREKEMKVANPRFVLRQWLLEEVISRVERDSESGKRVLAKVMHVGFLYHRCEAFQLICPPDGM